MSPLAVSVKTAAAMTEISETVLRDAIRKEQLPAYRVGRAIRVKVADLDAWVSSLTRVGREADA